MGKNRTMAMKNAKVVQFGIAAGKDAMMADVWNNPKMEVGTDGVDLYMSHSKYMAERKKRLNVGKWCARKEA